MRSFFVAGAAKAAPGYGGDYWVVPPVVPPPLPAPGVVVAPPPPAGGVGAELEGAGVDGAVEGAEVEGVGLDELAGVLSFLLQAVSETARTLARSSVFVIIRFSFVMASMRPGQPARAGS
ncbi:hypothetical protein [Bordetella genomosp. 11]|uniref:hypothetical protein n=1 Tax=Bordetella genomosp. 11 TaxID=1416808 RepID=UPI001595FE14|nr:hypothetical protein [Bordetella genomosp. 11]